MKVARYWVRETLQEPDPRGGTLETVAWGWSSDSEEEARGRARESAKRLAKWLRDNGPSEAPPGSKEYAYLCDRPPREEIIQEFHDENGQPNAIVTRNSYGSLVLNARDLMFVDVDVPQLSVGESLGRMIGGLFGKRYSAPAEVVLQRIREWSVDHPEFTVRIYRTAAGFRVAIANQPMKALSEQTQLILSELNSDPLYRRLCESQECFRARLTPKPWRIEVDNPPTRFPFADEKSEARYRRWVDDYDRSHTEYATCEFVEQHGEMETHPVLEPFLKLHDELTRCNSRLSLA